MRRFVIVFLLMVMPFQWSWAVAGGICEHETGKATQHFGHHNHEHDAKAVKAGKTPAESKNPGVGVDADCAYCHLLVAESSAPSHALASALADASHRVSTLPLIASLLADEPERPKWHSAH